MHTLKNYLLSDVSALSLELLLEGLDLSGELAVVSVHLLAAGTKGVGVLASLEAVDGIIIALVQGAATVLSALNLLHKARHTHAALLCFILKVHRDFISSQTLTSWQLHSHHRMDVCKSTNGWVSVVNLLPPYKQISRDGAPEGVVGGEAGGGGYIAGNS